jgi:membrane associated rhomboid family serine protease
MLATYIVYAIATVVGIGLALTHSVLDGVVGGFAALGGLITAWILFDTVKGKIEGFYEKKFAPKRFNDAA